MSHSWAVVEALALVEETAAAFAVEQVAVAAIARAPELGQLEADRAQRLLVVEQHGADYQAGVLRDVAAWPQLEALGQEPSGISRPRVDGVVQVGGWALGAAPYQVVSVPLACVRHIHAAVLVAVGLGF